MTCFACGHQAAHHCHGIGRCNVMVHTSKLTLAECNCPAYTEPIQSNNKEKA